MMLIEFKRKMGYRIGAKLLRATAHFFMYNILTFKTLSPLTNLKLHQLFNN